MMTAIPKKGRNGTYIYRYRCQRHSRKHDHLNRSRCPNAQTMRVEAVEERTWEKLGNAIGNFEWLSEKIAEALEHTTRPEYEKQVAMCQKKISSLTKELDKLVSLQATEARKVILASLERTLDAKAKALEIEEATLAELEGLLAASRSQADLLADVRDRVSAMVGKDITFDDKVRIVNALQVRVEIGERPTHSMKPLIYQNKLREKEGVSMVVKIILGEPPQLRGVSITGFDKSVNTAQAATQVAGKVKELGLAGE